MKSHKYSNLNNKTIISSTKNSVSRQQFIVIGLESIGPVAVVAAAVAATIVSRENDTLFEAKTQTKQSWSKVERIYDF